MRHPHERLKFIRQKRGFKQGADAVRAFGFEPSQYKSAENGTRNITPKLAEQLANAFRVRPGWLLFGEGEWDTGPTKYGKIDLAFSKVPLLDWEIVERKAHIKDVIEEQKHILTSQNEDEFGDLAFRLIVRDESMVDTRDRSRDSFEVGDQIVFDPEKDIHPGCYVLAHIFASEETVFRKYHEAGLADNGRKIVTLHALNEAWADVTMVPGESGEIIARLIRHTRDYI